MFGLYVLRHGYSELREIEVSQTGRINWEEGLIRRVFLYSWLVVMSVQPDQNLYFLTTLASSYESGTRGSTKRRGMVTVATFLNRKELVPRQPKEQTNINDWEEARLGT